MTDLGRLVQQTADRLARKCVGVVVAGMRGDRTATAAAGNAGIAGGAHPQAPDTGTLFEVGSLTKSVTSLTLARLSVAGTVGLDEPLADLLPPGTAVPTRGGEPIRLRHLATHTSGLPRLPKGLMRSVMMGGARQDPYAECTEEYVLGTLDRTKLAAPPGAKFAYSNLGGGLLGIALARRTGLAYDELVAREVLAPLRMADTSVTVTPEYADRLASGHTKRGKPTPPWRMVSLAGAGGLHSTATDMARFVRAFLDPEAVRGTDGEGAPQLAKALDVARRHEFDGGLLRVHLGWISVKPDGAPHRTYFHNGRTGGFAAFAGFTPKADAGVVVLSSTSRSLDRESMLLLRRIGDLPPNG